MAVVEIVDKDGGVAADLLAWYDVSARDLPWRARPGLTSDPYAVWLSEIMLQQTTVKAVIPYYARFLAKWPTVRDLARAALDDVLSAWAGLGYYSRAHNLHACAKTIVAEHGGHFPDTEEALGKLSGIGPYTAAAIAAIAFDRQAAVVDGNVERVVARLYALSTPLKQAKKELRQLTAELVPDERPGDFAQAMMDLGATLCTPRSPSCLNCPINAHCGAHRLGIAHNLPARAAKPDRPTRYGTAYFALHGDKVLLRKRAAGGLLGGMMEVPSTKWSETEIEPAHAAAPLRANWRRTVGEVRHTFTHFNLVLTVYRAALDGGRAPRLKGAGWRWVRRRDLGSQALPSVMRKIIAHGFGK